MKSTQTPSLAPFKLVQNIVSPIRRLTSRALIGALLLLVATASNSRAGTATWDSGGANPAAPADGAGIWDPSVANWSNGSIDNGWNNGDNAMIGVNNGAAGIISITNTAGVTVGNVTYNGASSGNYNVSGNTMILSGSPTITVANGVIVTNATVFGGSGYTKAGPGRLVLQPPAANTNVGPVTINAGTVQVAATSVVSLNDDVTVNPGATLLISASVGMVTNKVLTINGGAVTNLGTSGNSTESHGRIIFDNNGSIACAGAVIGQLIVSNFDFRSGLEAFPKFPSTMVTNCTVKSTPGTMIIQSRANSSAVNGIFLTMNAGTLISDYPNPAPNGDTTGGAKFINTAGVPLTLGGGTLFFRFNAVANRTEIVAGTLITPGATSLQMTNSSAANNFALTQNAITRQVGGTVNYTKAALSGGTANFTTTSANVSGILSGGITWAGTDWAIGTTIAPYSAYTTATDPTTWLAANNVSLNTSPSPNVPDLTSINSLRLNGTATVTLAGAMTLSSGGLLVSGTGVNSITGGTLKGGSGADLIVHQYSTGDLTINSTLADNGAATALTKSGPGKLIISGTDNMTGKNYLNGGTVEVSALSQLASGALVMNNGTLRYTGSDVSSSKAITLNGTGGTIDVAGSATLTQTASIVGGGGVNSPLDGANMGDWGGLTKIGSGTLMLAANNIYNGPTIVSNGVLAINGTNFLSGTSGKTNYSGGGVFTIYGGTLGGTGVISGPVTVKNGGTISPGDSPGTLTLASSLTLESGAIGLFEVANSPNPSDLLVVQGNLTINSGSTISLSILNGPLAAGTYTLIQYSGTKTGSFNPTPAIVSGAIDGSYTIDDSTAGQINLIVTHQVTITSQPTGTNVVDGQPFSVMVVATGTDPVTYQWYKTADTNVATSPVSGATANTYSVLSSQSSDSGYYRVVVTNNYNSVTSLFAFVNIAATPPTLSGPTNQTIISGNNATLTAALTGGAPAPGYLWYFGTTPLTDDGVHISGSTTLSLTITNVQYPADQGTYSLVATNSAGATTNSAVLTVIVTPMITTQPVGASVNSGSPASFNGAASGVPAPSLQWYKSPSSTGIGSLPIAGQTGNTLSIGTAQGSDVAYYSLIASNAAGTATSSVVKLTVLSTTLSQTTLAPANGATGVCYDTPLYVTFSGPISIVNSGKLRIFNANDSVNPVDVLDLSSNTVIVSSGINLSNNVQPRSLFAGDSQTFNYFPVIISGATAAIYPHSGVMTSNQTYFVTIDNGIVTDTTGAYFSGISDTNAWRFSTKPTGPANATNLVVAADGSGDFVTVQGAVDSIPLNNTNATLVNIKDGTYVEIVDVATKNNITFRGQSRSGTVVGYGNNNNINGSTHNRMAFKVNANDVAIENMTVVNTTPQGGQQAEALMIEGNNPTTAARRCIVNNADIVSRQDTVLANINSSQAYFYNSTIRGNFDYIWGGGNLFFYKCVMHTLTNTLSGSYNLTAARTDFGTTSSTGNWQTPDGTKWSSNGISIVSSTLEADAGVVNVTLAGANGTAGGLASWALCKIDTNVYITPPDALTNSFNFWQYQNTDLTGTTPVTFRGLVTLPDGDPRILAATNAVVWLGGWQPRLAPNIVTQPAGQSVNGGDPASFTVSATGIPDPSYQWQLDGTNLPGATGSSLTIPTAHANDVGMYSVIVSNAAGSVTSITVNLTVGNTAPSLTAIPDQTINPGATAALTALASDPDEPAQSLAFSLSAAPGGAQIDANSGAFSWRAPISAADTTNLVTVTVTDNGSPNLSASQSFNVIVNPLTVPILGSAQLSGGQFSLTVGTGTVGPDYVVLTSTNLASGIWLPIATNQSPAIPFTFIDPNASAFPIQFYRIQLAP